MRGPIAGFKRHLLVAVSSVVVATACMLGFLMASNNLPLHRGYTMSTVVPTSASLAQGARVTMAGVQVGTVRSVRLVDVGALVELRIDDHRVTPLPEDSRITIRQHSPLGENYVSLSAGRSRTTLKSGSLLPATQADEYVELDQILSALRGRTRGRARALIRGMSVGLAGRGRSLNRFLSSTSGTIVGGDRLFEQLADDRRQLSRLVDNLGAVSSQVADEGDSMRGFARAARTSMEAIASRDDHLRTTLDELPSTLSQARTTTATLQRASDRAAPVVVDLARALDDLRPAVALLKPAASAGQDVVGELGAAAPGLRQTFSELGRLSPPAQRVLPALRKTLCEANPAIRYLAPYALDTVTMMAHFGSSTNAYDATGHLIRATLVLPDHTVGLPESVQSAQIRLFKTGLFGQLRGTGYQPYLDPGRLGKNDGMGITGPGDSKRKYTRVQADC